MPSCPEIPHRHPLSIWMERLPMLQNRLAAKGFSTGPDRWLNLQDLLFRFHQEDRLPQEIRALRKFIRPLFCRNPEESVAFDNCFDAWVDAGRKDEGLPAAEPTASPYMEPADSSTPALGRPPLRPFRRWFLAVLVVSFSLLFLVIGAFLARHWLESPVTEPITEQTEPAVSEPDTSKRFGVGSPGITFR